MKPNKWIQSDLGNCTANYTIFIFRVLVSVELIVVHGFKKLGIGTETAEIIPNPFNLPYLLNEFLTIFANVISPVFIIIGLGTRFASIPILMVTLTGYFVVHSGGTLAESDIPFMYSMAFLLIAFMGGGRYSLDNILYEKSNNL